MSALETVLTILHAGGKFGGGGYKVSSGLHGVGSSVVNALSKHMVAEVYKDGKVHHIEFDYGKTVVPFDVTGKTERHGTSITFYPDEAIFKETVVFDYDWVVNYLRHQAYLTKGVLTCVHDERTGKSESFYFEGGIKSYVRRLNEGKEVLSDDIFYAEKEVSDSVVEVAVQYNDTFSETIRPFANNVLTPDGGTHVVGFRTALNRTINDYARKNGSIILYDSAYEAFITEDDVPHSIFECEGARECAIEFRSFSKTAGFTGLRLGYTVIPKDLKAGGDEVWPLWARRHGTKYNGAPYIIQRAGEAVYSEAGQKQVHEQIAWYLGNAKIISEGLASAGFEVYGGKNAPYVWMSVPKGLTSWEFFDQLLTKAGVVGTPGSGFGPHGEGYLRLSSFGDREATRKAIERIKNML